MKKYLLALFSIAFLATSSFPLAALAGLGINEFGQVKLGCPPLQAKGMLPIIKGAPDGDYTVKVSPVGPFADLITVNGEPGEPEVFPFNVPDDDMVEFDISTTIEALLGLGDFGEVGLMFEPGPEATAAGFTGGTKEDAVRLEAFDCDPKNPPPNGGDDDSPAGLFFNAFITLGLIPNNKIPCPLADLTGPEAEKIKMNTEITVDPNLLPGVFRTKNKILALTNEEIGASTANTITENLEIKIKPTGQGKKLLSYTRTDGQKLSKPMKPESATVTEVVDNGDGTSTVTMEVEFPLEVSIKNDRAQKKIDKMTDQGKDEIKFQIKVKPSGEAKKELKELLEKKYEASIVL